MEEGCVCAVGGGGDGRTGGQWAGWREQRPSGSSPVLTFGDFGLRALALTGGLHIMRESRRALGP